MSVDLTNVQVLTLDLSVGTFYGTFEHLNSIHVYYKKHELLLHNFEGRITTQLRFN